MLGRQQIANVSTAISELFKNAYDAYADHVEVDLFRSDMLMIIRDDGCGMTREDFENKWLVLGTESKMSGTGRGVQLPGKDLRPVMGEKGIGRLAIALLGSQVLILTRKHSPEGNSELVMCFIHWGIFEIPGFNLEDIRIPVSTITGGGLPSTAEVQMLVQEIKDSIIERLDGASPSDRISEILAELDDFQVDPVDLDQFLEGLSLNEGKSGTHFFITPANETIVDEIDNEEREGNFDFRRNLLGFCDHTFSGVDEDVIKTAFRDWKSDSESDDLIGPGEFFTKEELRNADHYFDAQVDEFGQTKGFVRIYEEQYPDHVIAWSGGHGKPTDCGPFRVVFGYVPGEQRVSTLPPEEWVRMRAKLMRIGGLYVYRNRIRVLPYGNSDVDWLGIEERRTRSASYYFFSYRLVFGAVQLTVAENSQLCEKAGREGFQQGKAYRQLQSILENIFLQLSADFFRKGAEGAEIFEKRKEELERKDKARKRREKLVSTKRKKLAADLNGFFEVTANGLPQTEISSLWEKVERRMETAAKVEDPDQAANMLLKAERDASRELSEIREKYKVKKPSGVGLSKLLQSSWEQYSIEANRLETEIFQPFTTKVSHTLGVLADEAKLLVDQRRRMRELLDELAERNQKNVKERATEVRKSAESASRAAIRTASDAINEFRQVVAEVEADFGGQDLSDRSEEELDKIRRKYESRIDSVGAKNSDVLTRVRDVLAGVSQNIEEGLDSSHLDMIEALEGDLLDFREEASDNAELLQLGLAIAIINHEFESSIRSIRGSLRELHQWARSNGELDALYRRIRSNFDHLDGHLNLFTPLQRRLYRSRIAITGSEIHHYVATLFEARLLRHSIKLEPSDQFLDSVVHAYPSTLYPVFVNIIDNACFWLKDFTGKREITLDADSSGYLISNTGPAIQERDAKTIFNKGFSRKPRGRGLGLYISITALQREDMDLQLVNFEPPTFRLKWPQNPENAE